MISNQTRRNKRTETSLPSIPNKRYFKIGEASLLCGVESYVLRYWEQEFPMLKPAKRRGNRRFYQRDEILLIRQIRKLLYEEGFTIEGARSKLHTVKEPQETINNAALIKNLIEDLESLLQKLKIEV